MQKVLTLTATCLLGILLCASAALADEVRTDHFTLNLPSGWTQPQPPQSANGATVAIFQNAKEQIAVTVTVTPAGTVIGSRPIRDMESHLLQTCRYYQM